MYTILDEMPKEGDYVINPTAPDKKPRLVQKFSNENDTLGMRLEPSSWFSWMPLRNYHKKVVFDNYCDCGYMHINGICTNCNLPKKIK